MMAIRNSPTLRAALVGEDLVLLDTRCDVYFCAPGAGEAWCDMVRGSDSVAAEALRALLNRAGYGPASLAPPPNCARDLPSRRVDDDFEVEVRPVDLWRLLRAWLDYLFHYRGKPFLDLLAYAVSDRSAAPVPPEERRRLAQVFLRLAVWLPVPEKCLVRSFLLLRFLHRSGATADWVIGVGVWPFRAHCWLEADGEALDDAPERLAAYTPILTA